MPEPEIKEDSDTKERVWFELNEYEEEFFKIDIPDLCEVLNAASFLNIKRLFLYGCQEAAKRMQNQSPEELRQEWGFEDDLTEEEKQQIREENIWCNC